MPPLSSLLIFVGAALALLLVPGPAVLYITTRSMTQGRNYVGLGPATALAGSGK